MDKDEDIINSILLTQVIVSIFILLYYGIYFLLPLPLVCFLIILDFMYLPKRTSAGPPETDSAEPGGDVCSQKALKKCASHQKHELSPSRREVLARKDKIKCTCDMTTFQAAGNPTSRRIENQETASSDAEEMETTSDVRGIGVDCPQRRRHPFTPKSPESTIRTKFHRTSPYTPGEADKIDIRYKRPLNRRARILTSDCRNQDDTGRAAKVERRPSARPTDSNTSLTLMPISSFYKLSSATYKRTDVCSKNC